jgi:hypothetical protein
MSTRYAGDTNVSSEKSRAEIERILARYGADEFMYGTRGGSAAIGFKANGKSVRFLLPLPDRNSKEFTQSGHVPPRRRTPVQIEEAYEQAIRQRWRALALVIKAKLEAVEAGIVTFADEFAMHMLLPDGSSVREHVLPEIDEAYRTGTVRSFLAIESGGR